MIANITGTVVYRQGKGSFRQAHPKTDASIRQIPVPAFAAEVIRRRLSEMGPEEAEWTIFHNRKGGPLSQHNLRRTFRAFLELAGLADSGISPRWYRRTGATVLARGVGADAAATHLGHTSTALTERHYIEPDTSIDFGSAKVLELTLRPVDPGLALLAQPETDDEEEVIDELLSADGVDDNDAA